jgi:hypothetical protein
MSDVCKGDLDGNEAFQIADYSFWLKFCDITKTAVLYSGGDWVRMVGGIFSDFVIC